jgi:3-oxoacyl-[acyl-carrier protein] reductase/(S)-1-phenylethanol dehydrogenase
VALVTGSAQGIGQALATRLAADGATVAVADLQTGADTVSRITHAGGTAQAFLVDLADAEQISRLHDEVTRSLGSVDILVNNAGIYPQIKLEELTLETWRKVFQVNVEAMFLTTQAFLPAMRERGWGRIINTGSNSAALVVPNLTHYIASKMAVIGFTRGIATEAGADGVTANVVAPSITRTPGTAGLPEAGFASFANLAASQAIHRTEVPDDLAGVVSFLASDDAAFMTGQVLYVDGGVVRTS